MNDVVVTGFEVFTCFGFGGDALRNGVFVGRHGFRPVTRFDTDPYRCSYAAQFPHATTTGPDGVTIPVRQREILLACADAALTMARFEDPPRAPVLVGTQGDLGVVNRFWRDHTDIAELTRSAPASLAHDVGERLGVDGPRLAFVNACVASSNAVVHACRMIESGLEDVVLCGGSYLVDEQAFSLFDSGRALTTERRMRPFHTERSGLLLGDGVAVAVLEAAGHAEKRGAKPLVRIAGWGMASDAHHVSLPHPEGRGAASAITAALRRSGIAADELGYINAHGTGTRANDLAETQGLGSALGPVAPQIPVSSTKSSTGHMLEATGLVELVICALALRDGLLPPTAGLSDPDPRCRLRHIAHQPLVGQPRYALTLNAAFGGLNTAVVLERS